MSADHQNDTKSKLLFAKSTDDLMSYQSDTVDLEEEKKMFSLKLTWCVAIFVFLSIWIPIGYIVKHDHSITIDIESQFNMNAKQISNIPMIDLPSDNQKRIKIRKNKIILDLVEWYDVKRSSKHMADWDRSTICEDLSEAHDQEEIDKLNKHENVNHVGFHNLLHKDRGFAYKCIDINKGDCAKKDFMTNVKFIAEDYKQEQIDYKNLQTEFQSGNAQLMRGLKNTLYLDVSNNQNDMDIIVYIEEWSFNFSILVVTLVGLGFLTLNYILLVRYQVMRKSDNENENQTQSIFTKCINKICCLDKNQNVAEGGEKSSLIDNENGDEESIIKDEEDECDHEHEFSCRQKVQPILFELINKSAQLYYLFTIPFYSKNCLNAQTFCFLFPLVIWATQAVKEQTCLKRIQYFVLQSTFSGQLFLPETFTIDLVYRNQMYSILFSDGPMFAILQYNSFSIGQTFVAIQLLAPLLCLISIMQKSLPGVDWDEIPKYVGQQNKEKRINSVRRGVMCLTTVMFFQVLNIASGWWIASSFNTNQRPQWVVCLAHQNKGLRFKKNFKKWFGHECKEDRIWQDWRYEDAHTNKNVKDGHSSYNPCKAVAAHH